MNKLWILQIIEIKCTQKWPYSWIETVHFRQEPQGSVGFRNKAKISAVTLVPSRALNVEHLNSDLFGWSKDSEWEELLIIILFLYLANETWTGLQWNTGADIIRPIPSPESTSVRPTVVSNSTSHVLVMKIQASSQNVEKSRLATSAGAHQGQHLPGRHWSRDALEDAFFGWTGMAHLRHGLHKVSPPWLRHWLQLHFVTHILKLCIGFGRVSLTCRLAWLTIC